ncbi:MULTISPECIES: hypothetical protein [Shouchella]|uniref:Uncharacterized protein n=1 Tax=Shouchella lehensis TaxID=300825 RepID=A0A4Y7WQT4_9BACI|nr:MULTISPECIES: hypothetical protein [Bacillaceae]RQW20909.1 hypothetical protein EH196_12640 [Bacillus sp. C1-1]TES50933.1 hypothetical protein E2L03_03155 [Shouchella lehensis]
MKKSMFFLRLLLLFGAFGLYLMSLLHLFPIWIATPLLFGASYFLFRPNQKKHRFKGYRSRG